MKSFVCTHCGVQVRRPTAPLRCEACGQQRIGLFKVATAPDSPKASTPAPPPPPAPAAPAPPPPPPTAGPAHPPQTPPTAPPVETAPPPTASPPPPTPTAPAPVAPPAPQPESKPPAPKIAQPGEIVWRYPILVPGQDLALSPLRNCPAVDSSGKIYACVGANLVALECQGDQVQEAWRYETGASIPGSPTLGLDGRLRVHSGDGQLHCVTPAGEQAWAPVEVGEPLGWSAPLVDSNNNTYLSSFSGGLLQIDSAGSRQSRPWFRSRQRFDSTGLIVEDTLFIGAEDGFIYGLATSGRASGKNGIDHLAGAGLTDWFINSAIALSPQNELIVAGRDEYLYGFSTAGQELWKVHLRGQMLGSPVVDAQGHVYVTLTLAKVDTASEGRLVSIDGNSHRVRWQVQADGPVESTPVIDAEGNLYFGDNQGTVYSVDPTGNKRWSTPVGSAVRSAGALTLAGQLVYGLDDGTLVGLAVGDCRLATDGWPKYLGTAAQSGQAP